MNVFAPALVRANRPSASRITDAVRAALGGYAAIINDAGELAPYVTFTRSSTATRYNSAGLLETVAANAPRYDYDPVTLQLRGLLIEEQRTNLLVRSAEFDNASWQKVNVTVTADAAIAPDGTSTADLIVPSTASLPHYFSQWATVVSGSGYTKTVYAKAGGYNWMVLWSGTTSTGAYFNLSNGTIGTVSAGVTASIQALPNGWYRCSVTNNVSGTSDMYAVFPSPANNVSSFAGDGTSGIYVWGAQLEAGAFATSYIPTTTAAVTRAADSATITGANFTSIWNGAEGTLFAEVVAPPKAGTNDFGVFTVSDNPISANWMSINLRLPTSRSLAIRRRAGVNLASISPSETWDAGQSVKSAFAYKIGGTDGLCFKGGTVAEAAGETVQYSMAQFVIGSFASNPGPLCGHIRRLRYYPKRLTNAQLQALTT